MDNERFEEYQSALDEVKAYPKELNTITDRLQNRIHQRKIKNLRITISSTITLFLIFVLIVNTPTAMAEAILQIPVIGSLAELVDFDKGLQNAVNNDYVKEVNLIEEDNGYTLGIPYVIADSKRLVLFCQLPDNEIGQHLYFDITKIEDAVTGDIIEESSRAFVPYGISNQKENKGLSYISIRSATLPFAENLKIYVTLKKEVFSSAQKENSNPQSDMFEPSPSNDVETLGSYIFELHLDDFKTPKVTTLNKEIEVMGQTIRINSVTEYPTGTEISVYIPDTNDSIINGIEMIALDTNGDDWGSPAEVISSGPNENNEILFYLEGDYFSSATLDKIQINGIRLIKKTEAEITIDLQNMTITPELSDIRILTIEHSGEKAYITYESDTDSLGIFKHEYKDTKGNIYNFPSESMATSDGKSTHYIAVVWPKDNKVILTRESSPMVALDEPVVVQLNE